MPTQSAIAASMIDDRNAEYLRWRLVVVEHLNRWCFGVDFKAWRTRIFAKATARAQLKTPGEISWLFHVWFFAFAHWTHITFTARMRLRPTYVVLVFRSFTLSDDRWPFRFVRIGLFQRNGSNAGKSNSGWPATVWRFHNEPNTIVQVNSHGDRTECGARRWRTKKIQRYSYPSELFVDYTRLKYARLF